MVEKTLAEAANAHLIVIPTVSPFQDEYGKKKL
jgi:hypothetical protein